MTATLTISIVLGGALGGLTLLIVWASLRSSSGSSSDRDARSRTNRASSGGSKATKIVNFTASEDEQSTEAGDLSVGETVYLMVRRSRDGRYAAGASPASERRAEQLEGPGMSIDPSDIARDVLEEHDELDASERRSRSEPDPHVIVLDLEGSGKCFRTDMQPDDMWVSPKGWLAARLREGIGRSSERERVRMLDSDGRRQWERSVMGHPDVLFSESGERVVLREQQDGDVRCTLLDAESGEHLCQLGKSSRLDRFEFEGEALYYRETDNNGEWHRFRVDEEGQLGDEYEVFKQEQKERRPYDHYHLGLSIVWDEVQSDEPDWERVEELLDAHHESLDEMDDKRAAKYHRHRGELLEARDADRKEIFEHWEKALELDESVGIKRRTKRLRKEVDGDG
jgi:hypothetical protein